MHGLRKRAILGQAFGIDQLAVFTPGDALLYMPPQFTPAYIVCGTGTRNLRPILTFANLVIAGCVFSGVMPDDYQNSSFFVNVFYATANVPNPGDDVAWGAYFERIDVDSLDLDNDSFLTPAQIVVDPVPANSGDIHKVQIPFTQAQADALQSGEAYRLLLIRATPSETQGVAGDAQVIRVEVSQ
jgi:hypothetical protein